ncbi:MAG: FAD-binding oxidoreductase [Balneolaceae bacterium]|nr:FAD-binding oxidoreductase [Balneolaceae bacterium]
MSSSKMDSSFFDTLAKDVSGPVILKGESNYEEFRKGWNGFFDKFPAAIVRCETEEDVVQSVEFVKKHDLPFSVRSGGHDYAGKSICDGGLVVDLSLMKSIEIDTAEEVAIVGPGVRWGEFDEAAQEHGLATTGATVSTVGIAGYTLGGGTGYLARKHGLALDNLLSARIVTASGEAVLANEHHNQDLFWAIRGGGGNFGIVTSFEFQLHETGPEIMAGQVVFPIKQAGDVLRFYREFMEDAPDELTCYAFFLNAPPIDAFPEKFHGKPVLSLVIGHTGDIKTATKELSPLLNFGDPMLNAVEPMPYTTAQKMFDEGMASGNRWYSKAHYMNEISDAAINTVLEHTEQIAGALSVAYFEPMGGKINRVEPELTAFPHRDAAYSLHIFAGWPESAPDEEPMNWVKEFHTAMSPYSSGGVYVNLMGQDEERRIPDAYGSNYERLKKIKKEWDPHNLFRSNQNIEPA